MSHTVFDRWQTTDQRKAKLTEKVYSEDSKSVTLPDLSSSRNDDWRDTDRSSRKSVSHHSDSQRAPLQNYNWDNVDWSFLPQVNSQKTQLTTRKPDVVTYRIVDSPRSQKSQLPYSQPQYIHTKGSQASDDRSSIVHTYEDSIRSSSIADTKKSSQVYPSRTKPDVVTYTYVEAPQSDSSRSRRQHRHVIVKDSQSDRSSTVRTYEDSIRSSSVDVVKNVSRASSISNLSKGYVSANQLNGDSEICFMNCIIQCLANTRPILEICLDFEKRRLELSYSAGNTDCRLVYAFVRLVHALWQGTQFISPTEFHEEISHFTYQFSDYREHDAHEFLMYLMDGLQQDLNQIRGTQKIQWNNEENVFTEKLSVEDKARMAWSRFLKTENSVIVRTFIGQMRSTLTCTKCNHSSVVFDPFVDLSLPIRKNRGFDTDVPLLDCFHLYTQQEFLSGDNQPFCDRCGVRRTATKQLHIQKFPRILIIHLKRFSMDQYQAKISARVNYPVNGLNLERFAAEHSPTGSTLYDLFAVVNHTGTASSGHYTAATKHPYTGEWHLFNDHRVTPLRESRVVTADAYILFYEYVVQ